MRFGRELRRWRKRRKLTQRVLAIRAGVNRVTVAHLERGATRPSLDLTWRLAQALQVKMADLLEGWGDEHRNGERGANDEHRVDLASRARVRRPSRSP